MNWTHGSLSLRSNIALYNGKGNYDVVTLLRDQDEVMSWGCNFQKVGHVKTLDNKDLERFAEELFPSCQIIEVVKS